MARLATVLPQKASDPIPLAFGSLHLLVKYAKLTAKDERLIESYFPGPLTLVCEISSAQDQRIIEDMLHTHGTIGVRIPDSSVERQISTELDRPITTCAITDDTGKPIRSFDDAVSLVRARMMARDERSLLFAVRMKRLAYQDDKELSTVASVQENALPSGQILVSPYSVYIYRPGLLEPEMLEDNLRKVAFTEVEDWT
jgi:hypothetical protein